MKKTTGWVIGMVVFWGLMGALRAQTAAEVWKLPEPAPIVGTAIQGGIVFVATPDAVLRRGSDKFSVFWKAEKPGAISHGPLIEGDRMYVVAGNQLLMSPLGQALAFKPVAVGADVWTLPRRVHDRWVVQTDKGVRQSRDLQKWEPLFSEEGIDAKHLAWHEGAWWALANPPPPPSKPAAVADGEGEEGNYNPAAWGGMPAPPRAVFELKRSTDLQRWTTVREVEVSLIGTGLFSFGGKLVYVGEAGLDLIPTDPAQELMTADASEWLTAVTVIGSRMWLATENGVLVSGENDPTNWTWMNGEEFSRELSGSLSALPALGQIVALGTSTGQLALLHPADQERMAAGGRVFAEPPYTAAPGFALRKLVRAGNSFYAQGEDKMLYHARLGGEWARIPIFEQVEVEVHDLATDGKKTLLVSLKQKGGLWGKVLIFALNDVAQPYYTSRSFRQSPKGQWLDLGYGGGRFFAWNGGEMMASGDGQNWQTITLPEIHAMPYGIRYVDGWYLVLLTSGPPKRGVLRTKDFQTWEPRQPVFIGGTGDLLRYATAQNGRAFFQYTARSVSSAGEVVHEDKLMASADAGVTWKAVGGFSTSTDTRLLGAFDEAGERHWLVFNDAIFASVGNSLTEWRRIAALDGRRFVPVGDTAAVAEVVPARGLVPFAFNREMLADSKPVAIRPIPATLNERLLFDFIAWDDAASAAPDIAALKAATKTFVNSINGLADADKAQVDRLRTLALRRLALFAPLPDVREVGGAYAFDGIKHRIAANEQTRIQRALLNVNGQDYQALVKSWKPQATRFAPPEAAPPQQIGYYDRRTLQTRAFAGEPGGFIDLFISYSSGSTGLQSRHASLWWMTLAPQLEGKAADEQINAFQARHGSVDGQLQLLRDKFDVTDREKRKPLDDATLAELEQLFERGSNYAAYWLCEEYWNRYRRDAVATRSSMGSNAQRTQLWARRGAERGYVPSMVLLALTYSHGIGGAGKENPAVALEWAQRARATDHPYAVQIFNPTELAIMQNDVALGGRSQRVKAFDPAIMDSLMRDQIDLARRIVEQKEPADGRAPAVAHEETSPQDVEMDADAARLLRELIKEKMANPKAAFAQTSDDPAGDFFAGQIEEQKDTAQGRADAELWYLRAAKANHRLAIQSLVRVLRARLQKNEVPDAELAETRKALQQWTDRALAPDTPAGAAEPARATAAPVSPGAATADNKGDAASPVKTAPVVIRDVPRAAFVVLQALASHGGLDQSDPAFTRLPESARSAARQRYEKYQDDLIKAVNSPDWADESKRAFIRAVAGEARFVVEAHPRTAPGFKPAALKLSGWIRTPHRERLLALLPPALPAEYAGSQLEAFLHRTDDPEGEYKSGLISEQSNLPDGRANAAASYLGAALADHVPAMLALVRVTSARLQLGEIPASEIPDEEKEIIRWVKRAADLGNGEALRVRAGWKANGQAGYTADRLSALVELERAAEAGDWPSMRLLAQAAHAGEWNGQNPEAAEIWLEKAKAAGDPEAGQVLRQLLQQKHGDAAALPETVFRDVPMALFQTLKSAHNRQQSFPWGLDQVERLRPGILGDDEFDEFERKVIAELAKPVFHVRLVALKTAVFAPDDLVLAGSLTALARGELARFAPLEGRAQRALWLETSKGGWAKAVAYARQGDAQRQEIIGILAENIRAAGRQSNLANEFKPVRERIERYHSAGSMVAGADNAFARADLLRKACEIAHDGGAEGWGYYLFNWLKRTQDEIVVYDLPSTWIHLLHELARTKPFPWGAAEAERLAAELTKSDVPAPRQQAMVKGWLQPRFRMHLVAAKKPGETAEEIDLDGAFEKGTTQVLARLLEDSKP